MSDRTFTLDEAQTLLPILESLLRHDIAGKKLIEEVDTELQDMAHRVFLNGGTLLNVVHLARRKPSVRRQSGGSRTRWPRLTQPASRSKTSTSDCSISPVGLRERS